MTTLKCLYVLVFISIFAIDGALAHYYDTLPKGVRLGAYRRVQTGEINANYNGSGSIENIGFNVNANTETLSGVNEGLDTIYGAINEYQGGSLSLGAYQISGSSRVSVDGLGFGYGFTDRLTGFVSVPTYRAETNIKFKQTQSGNGAAVSDKVCANGSDDYSAMLCKGVQAGFAALDNQNTIGEVTQGILVNGLGYKPVGNWSGQGLGDIELGALYRIYKDSQRGSAFGAGLILPTGRVDDPDILQDIGFGDGQLDAYGEIGGGHHLQHNWFVNGFVRYTYQFAGSRDLRLADNSSGLTDRKENVRFKLGNRITINTNTEYVLSDWLSVTLGYQMNKQESSKFYSNDSVANELLAKGTNTVAHELYASAALSSITPFLKKNFILPAKIEFIYRSTIGGVNAVKIDRIELDLRMMF